MSSRALDAMFAERVLGEEVVWRTPKQPLFNKRGDVPWMLGVGVDFEVPHFIHSLDAAWAGVEKLGKPAWLDYHNYPQIGYSAAITIADMEEVWSEKQPHPALALVKACLLAVGVSQEEIDAASSKE